VPEPLQVPDMQEPQLLAELLLQLEFLQHAQQLVILQQSLLQLVLRKLAFQILVFQLLLILQLDFH